MLLISRSKAADEGIEATPGLPERAGAGRWWVGKAEEGTGLVVDLGLAKLIQIPEELQNMCPAAHRQSQRRPVVPEVLAEGVPVAPLLVFIAAWSWG